MRDNDHTYFSNRNFHYFPCHKGGNAENFNCMFCYCPLYGLDNSCGGKFTYTQSGVKDCSNCLLPHSPDGYAYITKKLGSKTNAP